MNAETEAKREARTAQFRVKNAARKAGREAVGRHAYSDARALRKSHGGPQDSDANVIASGAFGNAVARLWNELIPGTRGVPRQVHTRKDEDDG